MKKRKEPSVSVAGRVGLAMRDQLLNDAKDMEISLCECVSMYLAMGMNSDGFTRLKHQLQDATDQIEEQQREITRLRKESVWLLEPYTSLLDPIIRCDSLLEKFYNDHGKTPVSSQELKAAGFSFNAILASTMVGSHAYYITGRFRWAFVDATQKLVNIRKRD